MVSKQKDDNHCPDRKYHSDDEYSNTNDAKAVEAYDDNEVDKNIGMIIWMMQDI
jgi:hypothetical protein